jgi:hypothetical protein
MLSGCGKSTPGVPAAPVERGIFVSSGDCAETGKLTIDQCGQAIDKAVALHQSRAPSYKTLAACTAKEGSDRCAKGIDDEYHPNVEAFLITFGSPPSATPLYGTSDGSVGFRGLENQKFGLNDDRYSVSDSARIIAHENAKKG